jgi:hypothetical protein
MRKIMPHPIYRVFISSTFIDLAPERRAAQMAVDNLNEASARVGIALIPVDLQRGAQPEAPLEICIREAKGSDIMITLVGKLYGSETGAGISFTEAEFDAAMAERIDRFAYYKDPNASFLPEHVDTDPAKQRKLEAFREKIDGQLKRETFLTADELRGHIIRDLLRWLLLRPEVVSSMARMAPATVFPGSRTYFDAVNRGDLEGAADVALSRTFTQDMRRHGLGTIHQAILADLLGLGKAAGLTIALGRQKRGQVLLRFIQANRGTLPGAVALREAQAMVKAIAHPGFTYEVAAEELMSMVEAHRFDLAEHCMSRMLDAAKATKDVHTVAQAFGVIGEFFSAKGDHAEALKAHWEEINTLCAMKEICPFCLSDAFRHAGAEHMALGECILANDRFGKSLMVARCIPNRTRQIQALHLLARHWAFHGELRHAVAGYVLLARLAAEHDPTRDDASISLLLGELEVDHGKEEIGRLVRDVAGAPETIVDEALAPYDIANFTAKLDLKRNAEGDHW